MKKMVNAKDIYYRLECCKSSYSDDKSDYAQGYLMGIAIAQNMVALEALSHRAIQVDEGKFTDRTYEVEQTKSYEAYEETGLAPEEIERLKCKTEMTPTNGKHTDYVHYNYDTIEEATEI